MRDLTAAFAELIAQEPRHSGAAISLCCDGQQRLSCEGGDASEGRAWQADTLVPIFSATKPASAATLLLALERQGMSPYVEIGEIWPSFPVPHGTVAQLLSHQLGLAALDRPACLFDLEDCREAIEQSRPLWSAPQHGYHPHTLGPIIDLLMLCLTGQRLGAYWEKELRAPLGLDFYIGLPESQDSRVALLRAPRLCGSMPKDAFYRDYFDESSEVYRSFHSITGIDSIREMNAPRAWQCADPAKGGIASARGLAMFYQALMGKLEGSPFSPELLDWMSQPQSQGDDWTLMQSTSFSCGAMLEPAELFMGGFGHAGAGGSHAFCLPEQGLSFAFVMNQMDFGVLPGSRLKALLAAMA